MTASLLKLLRGGVLLLGCAILAILVARLAIPGSSLEMAENACAVSAPDTRGMSGLERLAMVVIRANPDRLAGDWANLCKYRAANAEVLAGPPVRAVMIGDSITEHWQVDNPELFRTGVVNRGSAGHTSTQMLARFEQDVVSLHPRIVHIMAGLNDIAGVTGKISPADYKNNISAMLDIAQANGIAVMLASITPARQYPWRKGIDPSRRIVELNHWLSETARARGLIYVDYHAVLADRRGHPRPEFDLDGLHPNPAGYAAMKPVLQAALAEAEARLKPASAGAASAGGGS